MYANPRYVLQEINRRRRNPALIRKVLDYLGGSLPEGWPTEYPIATLNRYLATARLEDHVFTHAAKSIGLRPYWPTYLAQLLIATNPEAVGYLRPRVIGNGLSVTKSWLVKSWERWNRQPLGSIQVSGTALVDIHHQLRETQLPLDVVDNVFDVSAWNTAQAVRAGATGGRLAQHYYRAVMAQYIVHGVLFEDFSPESPNAEPYLDGFVRSVVKPAFAEVEREFGLRPLIVHLPDCIGLMDYPAGCGPIFDRYREVA